MKYILVLTFLFSLVLNAQQFVANDAFYTDRIIGLDSVNVYQYKLIKYDSKNQQKTNYLYYLNFNDDNKFESSKIGSDSGLDADKSISGNYQLIDNSHILLKPELYHNTKKPSPDSMPSKSYLFFILKESEYNIKLIQSNGNIKDDQKNAILSKKLDEKVKAYNNHEKAFYELIKYTPQSKANISRINEYVKNVLKKNPNDYHILFTAWYPDDYLVNMVYNKKTKKTIFIINYIAKYVENGMGQIPIK
ncbi:hypothetical protein N0B40_12190 [Chryseobacterium oranimense]|uniref:hypothetical protein n=1 Tax=Chryseobacterium oranimense TaxID=421058 RepID=UPI0021AFF7F2|nr:hypothetical protein [Chryseobacterium oranimense]UWX59180.1 hypothetical protein N0B40_12190 [Chryseobacterium oranimense]